MYFYNCIYIFSFGCAGSSLLHGLLSGFGEWGLLSSCSDWASHWGSFSCGAQPLGRVGFNSCSSKALELRFNSCGSHTWLLCGMWDLPGPGIEPVLPSLAGGFFITEPPGKPQLCFLFYYNKQFLIFKFFISNFFLLKKNET